MRILLGVTAGLLLALPCAARAHPNAQDLQGVWAAMGEQQGLGLPDPFARAGVEFGKRTAVPQLPCQPGDRPETGLQGRVSPADVVSGRAAQGYNCNLELVGSFLSPGGGSFDTFGDCAYYGMAAGAGATEVLDVSDGRLPLPTATLTSTAMRDPWESLRVNAKRELLVADSPNSSSLDIYDVSQDCRQPRLLSSTDLAPGRGHEGWFSPDGMTYYMSTTGSDGTPTTFPVDIRDPANPKLLAEWTFESQTHGGSTTEDGTRTYICQQQAPPKDKLLVVDTSEVAAGKTSPEPHLLAEIPLDDNQWCQSAYRVTYDGHPFLIQWGERSGAADCSRADDGWANFGYPRIFDLADERNPKLVSSALLEVHLPENCEKVTGEGAINGLGYSVHQCSPDRLYNPTILACGWFYSGMRVLDIRDPYNPVEIGYFNPGQSVVVGAAPHPVVRSDRKEIWFVHDTGFYSVRFENGTWPFEGAPPCPEFDDYLYAHYNPQSTCPTANFNGIGKPAPGGVPPRCGGRAATIFSPSTTRVSLRGTRGADVIVGGRGDDRIRGGGGDDLICGRGGDDVLRGGRGDDLCRGGRSRSDKVASCERTRAIP